MRFFFYICCDAQIGLRPIFFHGGYVRYPEAGIRNPRDRNNTDMTGIPMCVFSRYRYRINDLQVQCDLNSADSGVYDANENSEPHWQWRMCTSYLLCRY